MKILVLAIIAIGVYFGYVMIVGGVKAAYDPCITIAKETMDQESGESCTTKQQVMQDLVTCIEDAKKEDNFKAYLYGPLGYESTVGTMVINHNKECRNSKVTVPGEGLYLQY